MKLDNAPVIQTWIAFTFAPSPQKREWDMNAAREFLYRYRESFTHVDAIFDETYHIEEISPSRPPEVVKREVGLDRVRARDEKATRWLQLANDQMVFNIMRGHDSPDYQFLREEALSKLEDYVAFFGPTGLERAELHYVDIIEIPKPPDGHIKLDEYFNLRVELPETFGPTWYFSFRLLLRPPVDGDILEVRFQSEVPKPNSSTYRFRTDWHMICANIATLDRGAIGERLDRAHDCLFECFQASVTPETWKLFHPSE